MHEARGPALVDLPEVLKHLEASAPGQKLGASYPWTSGWNEAPPPELDIVIVATGRFNCD